jgi:hypothetical protein
MNGFPIGISLQDQNAGALRINRIFFNYDGFGDTSENFARGLSMIGAIEPLCDRRNEATVVRRISSYLKLN